MKTLYEIYIVKEDNLISYKIINEILASQIIRHDEFYSETNNTLGLKVYINNEEVYPNSDFSLFNGELIFTNPLSIGDKIIIKDSILDNVKFISKNSYSKNSLFKYFTSEQKLKNNQIYDFILNVNGNEYTSKFLSKYDPLYSTVEKIRMDTGDLLINVPDSQILKIIYLNSKEALEKLESSVEDEALDEEVLEKTPAFVKRYVRYRTDIDFCYAIYLSISGKYGTQVKKVGDISIENTVKLPYINEMISRFKELLKPNEDLFGGTGSTTASFVKGGNTSYPAERTTVF